MRPKPDFTDARRFARWRPAGVEFVPPLAAPAGRLVFSDSEVNSPMTPTEIRRLVQRKVKAAEHILKAVIHTQAAHAMVDDLPDRETDPDAHDSQVKTLHGVVRAAWSSLETHFGRAMRSGDGSSGPSSGDELDRAKDAIGKADAAADEVVEAIGDDEVDEAANDMHFHLKQADRHLENYTASVINNPESKSRQEIARAFARTILAGYGAGRA